MPRVCRRDQFLTASTPIALRVTCRGSRLYHTDAVAERVVAAISTLGTDPVLAEFDEDRGGDAQLIVVRLVDNSCTVSVDSSGPHLHRRGYRLATAKAPLRETLAAAMVLASGWDPSAPLLDPFCGSGTIAIEAALIASRRWPNAGRSLPLKKRSPCAAGLTLVDPPDVAAAPPAKPILIASDRDAGAVEAARANAERAGVSAWITFPPAQHLTFTRDRPGLDRRQPALRPTRRRVGPAQFVRAFWRSAAAALRRLAGPGPGQRPRPHPTDAPYAQADLVQRERRHCGQRLPRNRLTRSPLRTSTKQNES